MDRRSLLLQTLSLPALATVPTSLVSAAVAASVREVPTDFFGLTRQLDPQSVEWLYSTSSRDFGPAGSEDAPYVYAFFDEENKKFVKPTELAAIGELQSCTLEAKLQAFNLSHESQSSLHPGKQQVLLSFNAAAPPAGQDRLNSLFMNGLDVFLAKNKDRPDQLTKFLSDNGPAGVSPVAQPTAKITDGKVSLQVQAFGQRADGFWKHLLDALCSVGSSPLSSAVARGFGVPGLTLDALQFVNHSLNVFHQQESLLPLWSTGSLEFTVHKDVPGRFAMRSGLWTTVDAAYAKKTNFLQFHTLDLEMQSLRLLDGHRQAANANYLVMDVHLTK